MTWAGRMPRPAEAYVKRHGMRLTRRGYPAFVLLGVLEAAGCLAAQFGMRTYLAECALLGGYLALDWAAMADRPAGIRLTPDQAPAGIGAGPTAASGAMDAIPQAAADWTQADRLIRETGYGRREAELHLLEARLKHRQARAALARAESRLRAIGQWGLWPELVRVAAELGLPAPVID